MITHIARQAIYNIDANVIAYELLFRDGKENCFPDISPDEATSNILANSHLSIGLENITTHKTAFINFHKDTLIHHFPTTLDPKRTVIEIVETVNVTDELVKACKHIKGMGYKLALDDYDFSEQWKALESLVDYVKIEVDYVLSGKQFVLEKIKAFKQLGITLIAEKVETQREFNACRALGFQLFQGYFLSKPEMIEHKSLDAAASSVMELISISSEPEFDFAKLNAVFEKDLGLSFKLMRFINNPTFNKRERIESLEHALKYLGSVELKKFIALLAIANLRGSKPEALLVMSLVRGQFCKIQADLMSMAQNPPSSLIMGLFSFVDALIDMPMEKVTQTLPFSDEIKSALCSASQDKTPSCVFGKQLLMCKAFEHADFHKIAELCKQLNMCESDVFEAYYASMLWAEEMRKCAQ
ncbi:EAL and HDOD domain-containing protein [Agaribacter flavus]|uniref:EAL and HDOD domain-containing protein n=1 Tax=Agaribacter flavus TaxID=1902781 RepID=A0ABV7FSZ3_9ALTE